MNVRMRAIVRVGACVNVNVRVCLSAIVRLCVSAFVILRSCVSVNRKLQLCGCKS